MGKLINFQQYVEKGKKHKPPFYSHKAYRPTANCKNPDSYGMVCVKCGKCGRKLDELD